MVVGQVGRDAGWVLFWVPKVTTKTDKNASQTKNSKLKEVKIHFCNPPTQMSKLLYQNIMDEMTMKWSSKGFKLIASKDAPAIVPVVYISRIVADIKRDLKRITGSK